MKRSSPKKSFLPRLMALAGLAGLLLLPQATSAGLWVHANGTGANCHRGLAAPVPPRNTCDSLNTAAGSSTGGMWPTDSDIIHSIGTFSTGATLTAMNNERTTWTNWPGQSDPVINVSSGNYCFDIGRSRITIEHFTCQNAPSHGIRIGESGTNTVRDCSIHDNGGSGIYGVYAGGPFPPMWNGNNLFERNYIYDNGSHGIRLEGNSYGGIDQPIAGYNGGNIFNNIIYGNDGDGVLLHMFASSVIYNNTISNDSVNQGDCISLSGWSSNWASTDMSIQDNILIVNAAGGATSYGFRVGTNATGSFTSNYNDIYLAGTGGGPAHTVSFAGNNYATLANWQAAPQGQDANSTDMDPNLDGNYHLQSGSPLNSLGTNLSGAGITDDIDGDPRPNSQGDWSMGGDQRDDGGGGIPEFTLLTMVLALIAGAGIIILVGRVSRHGRAIG